MSDESTLETLANLPPNEGYTPNDRWQDFRKSFTTDEGKRVLREIISWCHLLRPSIVNSPVDSHLMAMREGERNIGLRLLATINNEPRPKPERTTRNNV